MILIGIHLRQCFLGPTSEIYLLQFDPAPVGSIIQLIIYLIYLLLESIFVDII